MFTLYAASKENYEKVKRLASDDVKFLLDEMGCKEHAFQGQQIVHFGFQEDRDGWQISTPDGWDCNKKHQALNNLVNEFNQHGELLIVTDSW
jgi:hypothetical protein